MRILLRKVYSSCSPKGIILAITGSTGVSFHILLFLSKYFWLPFLTDEACFSLEVVITISYYYFIEVLWLLMNIKYVLCFISLLYERRLEPAKYSTICVLSREQFLIFFRNSEVFASDFRKKISKKYFSVIGNRLWVTPV